MSTSPLLRVDDLSVAYGRTTVVSDVGFDLDRGRSLALIGESGSGKSTIARAILRLLPRDTSRSRGRASGRIAFEGTEVLGIPDGRFRALRGRRIGYVPQDPAHALNAVRTVGSQAREAAARAGIADRAEQRRRILEVFDRVGLPSPERVFDAYPHELSGGMLQRVLIGLAVLPRPALLVADEPTSALDVTIQKRILDLLAELRAELDLSLLLITHDLAIAAERTDAIVVLKDGRIQEAGSTAAVFAAPSSAYTRRLQGDVPALNPDRYADRRGEVGAPEPAGARIEVADAVKAYGGVRAVDGVSFTVEAGTTHALVGESGSGKTTTIRLLLGLEEPDAGELRVAGESVVGRTFAERRLARRHLQLVYQNPFTSLDPTWRVDRLIREPLDRFGIGTSADRRVAVTEALVSVGLDAEHGRRRPSALSGGQRQRVAIARALVLRPDVIVLDEPTSALDVSVQAEIFDLLVRLQTELGLTYLLVSHDLALVRQVADTVTVLRQGVVVESGDTADVLAHPRTAYTRTLIDAIPRPAVAVAPTA